MFLELRRVFSGMAGRGRFRLVFDFLVLPLLVAAIMTTAFLARSSPDAYRDSFLYFGTLYAFWCGLFGACQAFNGEVASGEWSYWMLGMRRCVVRHYAAHFAVATFFGAIQVAVSLFFLWGLWWLGAKIKPLGFVFVSPDEGGPFVNQVVAMMKGGSAYNLEGLQATMNHFDYLASGRDVTWFSFCLKFYLLGAGMAVISGVVLGLLVSALCPSPQISLTAAVLLVVACTIFSHTGIRGNANSSADVREFAPVALIARQYKHGDDLFGVGTNTQNGAKMQPRWRDGGTVEMASFILPQRYFFNIARTPCLELDYSLGIGNEDLDFPQSWRNGKRLLEHAAHPAKRCKCPVCIGIVGMAKDEDGEPLVVEVGHKENHSPLENHWIGAGAGVWKDALFTDEEWRCPGAFRAAVGENRGGIASLLAFCAFMAWREAGALATWCAIAALLSIIQIYKKGMFHELR